MTYLALAILCSLGIGAIFKHAAETSLDRMLLLRANYLAAALCAGLGLLADGLPAVRALASASFLAFGVFSGVVLIGAFFVFALATQRAGMSLTISVTRVGVSIPFLVSWLAWGETPGLSQWTGLALVGLALFLITRPVRAAQSPVSHHAGLAPGPPSTGDGGTRAVVAILILCFLAGGFGDLTFKAFDMWHAAQISTNGFIFVAFGSSFVVALGLTIKRRGTANSSPGTEAATRGASNDSRRFPTLLWGTALGVINYASLFFILRAVAELPGTVVFPTHAVSAVVGGAIIGALVWKERLSSMNIAGVLTAAVAVLLLNG